MWRNTASRRNWRSINQTAQCLKRSTVLSFSSDIFSEPVNPRSPYAYCEEKRRFQEVMVNQSDFSLSFAKHLFLKELDKNVFFSPLLTRLELSIVAAGCQGSTLKQLLCLLKASSEDDLNSLAGHISKIFMSGVNYYVGRRLHFTSSLWFDQSLILKPSFKQFVSPHYNVLLFQRDFRNEADKVTQQINSLMELRSSGLIKDLIPRGCLGISDRLVFVNALYYKVPLLQKYDSSETKNYKFHLSSGSSVEVPFMTSKENHLLRVCDGFKVLGLCCVRGYTRRWIMYIFLPYSNDGLASLVEKFDSQPNFLERHIPKVLARVGDFRIPRFKFSYTLIASDLFKQLGLTWPFLEGKITEMADSIDGERVSVSNVFQQSLVQVNEDRTDAETTNSKIGCVRNLKPHRKIDFVADHPFLFVIRDDKTGAVVFVGQVHNPLES